MPSSFVLEENFVPEKVEPTIYRRKEKDMVVYKSKNKSLTTMCKFSPWTGFKFLVTASLLTVNLNISNSIEVYP